MIELMQQLAVLDSLLGNWSGILVRMGPTTPALTEELSRIAVRLAGAADADAIAAIVDDLLDLVQDTPAANYVSQLIMRTSLGTEFTVRTRDAMAAAPVDRGTLTVMTDNTLSTGRDFGRAVAAQTESGRVPLFFATNRRAVTPEQGHFGAEEGTTVTYGLAQVTIPVDVHRTGRVELSHWWQPFPNKDDKQRYVVLGDTEQMSPAAFRENLGREVGANDLLVFLHGYNVTFEEAAQRAAQLAWDLLFSGRVLLFSWPSLGSLPWYVADEERAAAAAAPLHELLQLLAEGPWNKVHLLAHSMGNRVLLSGLADQAWPNSKLSQIVFVAADVPVNIFQQKFPRIRHQGERYTSYVSDRDRALWISSLLHRLERVGISRGEPFVTEGLETIEASNVNTSLLGLGMGHSYFGDKRSLLGDIGYLLRERLPAERRGLPKEEQQGYWYFPR